MLRSVIVLVLCLFLSMNAASQSWEDQLKHISYAPFSERDMHIQTYIKEQGGLPLVYPQGQVVFLHYSPMNAPRIMSGFNGFLSTRYTEDFSIGDMTQIEGTDWYYYVKVLPEDARIFYQFQRDGKVVNDPLNPNLGFRFTLVNSELRMPKFTVEPELIRNQFTATGKVEKIDLPSTNLKHTREVHVYTPPNYQKDQSYPLVMFHDGNAYLEMANVPQVLDYLISHQKIRPIVAVFDEPQTRGEEYRGHQPYINYVDQELIPYIQQHYAVSKNPDHCAVIGGSRGGLSSLILSHSISRFSKIGAFSPAIHPRGMEDFNNFLKTAPHHPNQVAMLGARYDKTWYPDALALKEYFERSPADLHYLEINQGHNIQAWIGYLDELLQHFYGI